MQGEEAIACLVCKRPRGPSSPGDYYNAVGSKGMVLPHLWICNTCALSLGPKQGLIEPFQPPEPQK